jgi:hypothetical protein
MDFIIDLTFYVLYSSYKEKGQGKEGEYISAAYGYPTLTETPMGSVGRGDYTFGPGTALSLALCKIFHDQRLYKYRK